MRLSALLPFMAAAAMAVPVPAFTHDYPDRVIRLIAPVPPGGMNDTFGRIFAEKLSEILRQRVILENRPGAAGTVGARLVANADPDGYTLCWCQSGSLTLQHQLMAEAPYDPLKDFEPITRLWDLNLILTSTQKTAKNFDDFLRVGQIGQTPLTYGSAGVGSLHQLVMELAQDELSIKLTHVPYAGDAQQITDLMSGKIELATLSPMAANGLRHEQNVVFLASLGPERSPLFPDTLSLVERGYEDVHVTSWLGVVAPAQTPSWIVERLNAALQEAMKDPAVLERMRIAGIKPTPDVSPDDLKAFIQQEIDRLASLIKKSKGDN
ncbi:Bug family tripartite tricarboxylate transporter substrate binding protein [Rhizobium gallicum]|nr:tripartite tricarboxylate transporter substrate binding protein [Rhizobium gallicum]